MALVSAPASLDDQLTTLRHSVFDHFIAEQRQQWFGQIDAAPQVILPKEPGGQSNRTAYRQLQYIFDGKWQQPKTLLQNQPTLLALVQKLQGFINHRQTLSWPITEGNQVKFTAKIFDQVRDPNGRFRLDAVPRDPQLHLSITYFPPPK
jgi:hypothetical protein